MKSLNILPALAITLLAAVSQPVFAQQSPNIHQVHKIFIEPMQNGLDQYIRAEMLKKMPSISVVLDKADADAVLTGLNNKEGQATQIVGRYLGVVDTDTAVATLTDRQGKTILWSDQAGDRNLFFSVMHSGGQRKVASRLVDKLKKAMRQ